MGCGVWGLDLRVERLGFRAEGLGFGVQDLGLRGKTMKKLENDSSFVSVGALPTTLQVRFGG